MRFTKSKLTHPNNKFSVMGTACATTHGAFEQTCWLQEFQKECPFKCSKPGSYEQLSEEESCQDHMQPGHRLPEITKT